MKELKFTCPSCGQHIQCDCKHAGENVPCPGCATMIRVPALGNLTEVPGTEPESQTVSYVAAKSAGDNEEKNSAPRENPVSSPAPAPAHSTLPKKEIATNPPAIHAPELTCPVCQSKLRISVEAESPGAQIEHEQEIATGHKMPLLSKMKPRLDLALKGTSNEPKHDSQDKPGIHFEESKAA